MNILGCNFFCKRKDGGKDSPVDAYFLFEIKGLFSVALLKFNKGMREQYHSHAFNAYTWLLKGALFEEDKDSEEIYVYERSLLPKYTPREKFHRVRATETSWCLTVRGRWQDTWQEYDDKTGEYTTFTHGRVKVK